MRVSRGCEKRGAGVLTPGVPLLLAVVAESAGDLKETDRPLRGRDFVLTVKVGRSLRPSDSLARSSPDKVPPSRGPGRIWILLFFGA